jgi:hypothetical protein
MNIQVQIKLEGFLHNLLHPLFLHLALLLIHPVWALEAIESPHTCVANLLNVSGKVVGNKRRRLNGDMASIFQKLIEYSTKLKL